ncbi:MAG: SMC-Scp complex subunit ScpB [Gammaproteobacteria bacterium]|nr:SMC-Scp complex subunit ScpB [Gammaproteobacteria bacterium]
MNDDEIKNIVEAALLASGNPLTLDDLLGLFQGADNPPGRDTLRGALATLAADYEGRGIEVKEVASGYRVQVRQGYAERIRGLWTERPGRYSRALLETLVLIAYRQPITRGEIEDIRGVAVSTNIIRTLQERDWVRVVGHRDVPGHPAMYGTTRQFLDYFNLRNLAELPSLAEIRDIDEITRDLFREQGIAVPDSFDGPEPEEREAASDVDDDTGVAEGAATHATMAEPAAASPEASGAQDPPDSEADDAPRDGSAG